MTTMKIFKYPLGSSRFTDMLIPIGARILSAQYQQSAGAVCLWLEVDPSRDTEVRSFALAPTGGDVPERSTYISTVQIEAFVFHVYEVRGR